MIFPLSKIQWQVPQPKPSMAMATTRDSAVPIGNQLAYAKLLLRVEEA